MRIIHEESGTSFEVTEQQGGFMLVDSRTSRTYSFKESYEAIWTAIELVRQASFDDLKDADLSDLARRSHLTLPMAPKAIVAMVKKEKINRTYYDQIFLKLLTQYRTGHESVKLSNSANFSVQQELVHLLRMSVGARFAIPSVQA